MLRLETVVPWYPSWLLLSLTSNLLASISYVFRIQLESYHFSPPWDCFPDLYHNHLLPRLLQKPPNWSLRLKPLLPSQVCSHSCQSKFVQAKSLLCLKHFSYFPWRKNLLWSTRPCLMWPRVTSLTSFSTTSLRYIVLASLLHLCSDKLMDASGILHLLFPLSWDDLLCRIESILWSQTA